MTAGKFFVELNPVKKSPFGETEEGGVGSDGRKFKEEEVSSPWPGPS